MLTPRTTLYAGALAAALAACGSNPNTMHTSTPDGGGDAASDGATVVDASSDGASDSQAPADAATRGVVRVSGSSFAHTCALLAAGTVRCWGVNDNGQLGIALAESRQQCRVPESRPAINLPCELAPRDVPNLSDVADITAGNGGTCALKRDGSVWCWGANDVGELGQGNHDTTAHPTPARVNLPAARQVAYGAFHVCAALMDGTVQCWGNNKFGQAGTAPAMSDMQCDPGDGETAGCLLRPRAVPGITNARQVTAGRNHSCALLMDGTVRCWGLNDSAQLGTGMVEDQDHPHPEPVTAMGLTGVVQIAAGGSHTCARRSDGSVHCWGWNDLGQLGTAPSVACTLPGADPFQCAQAPVAVPELTGALHIAAGRWHTCAVVAGGAVRCAGRNDEGQLGTGALGADRCSVYPDIIACTRRFSDVTIPATAELTVGNYHSCARLADGTVRCWGAGYYGQAGDGMTTNRLSPVAASNLP